MPSGKCEGGKQIAMSRWRCMQWSSELAQFRAIGAACRRRRCSEARSSLEASADELVAVQLRTADGGTAGHSVGGAHSWMTWPRVAQLRANIAARQEIISGHEETLREYRERPPTARPSVRIGTGTSGGAGPDGRHGTRSQPVDEYRASDAFVAAAASFGSGSHMDGHGGHEEEQTRLTVAEKQNVKLMETVEEWSAALRADRWRAELGQNRFMELAVGVYAGGGAAGIES
ncbi:hypothetical protein CYMTET_5605 [Cymbomonas tetramitiformis]|uniref:Uncharacterized protein n=1 Tax=Cymbomonas tetramitiformis TaxID=36881 RepID=A0AAE0LIP6_9CHLO|nr:hypothetical protein CYMTET_5605 [Cymbomonas tetramitiformis]